MSKDQTQENARAWFFNHVQAMESWPDQVIVPNQRLALFLARDWASQMKASASVWQPLHISPWQQWVQVLWQDYACVVGLRGQSVPVLLSQQDIQEYWDALTKGRHTDAAIEADRFAREWNLSDAEGLCNDHQRLHRRWRQDYATYKQRYNRVDTIDILHILMTHMSLLKSMPTRIYCYGFVEFSPLQQQFWQSLEALDIQCIRHEPVVDHQASPRFEQWLDPSQELYGAAHWAKAQWHALAQKQQFNADDPFDGPRIALIVPDLAQHQESVKSVVREVLQWQGDLAGDQLPWTISAGQSLSEYGLLSTLLDIIDLCCHRVSAQGLERLFNTSHWAGGLLAPLAPKCLEAIRQSGRAWWRLTDFHQFMVRQLSHCGDAHTREFRDTLLAWFEPLLSFAEQVTLTWQQWLNRLLECVTLAGWPGPEVLSSTDYQLLQRWHHWWLAQAQEQPKVVTAASTGTLSYGQMIARLRQQWRETMFQPEADTDRIMVLGIMEAAALPLDAVYIIRLSAEYWPASSRPNPFLPYELQRSANVPRATPLREVWYGESLLRLYHSASTLMTMSYSSARDDVPQFPSPLLGSVFGAVQFQAKQAPLWQDRVQPQWHSVQDQLVPLQEVVALKGGVNGLVQQGVCPFLGALATRIQPRPIAYRQRAITGGDRGRWLHQVMEKVWQILVDKQGLLSHDVQCLLKAQVNTVMLNAAAQLPTLLTPMVRTIEEQRLLQLAQEALRFEAGRADFSVQGVEVAYPLTVNQCDFKLRLDRWDLEQKRWVIIDYKSRLPMISQDRQLTPQLLLYALALAQHQGVAFEQIPKHLGQAVYFAMKPQDGVQWVDVTESDETVAAWFDREFGLLSELLIEIRQGCSELRPYQGPKTCDTCDYQSFCRVKHRSLDAAGGSQ